MAVKLLANIIFIFVVVNVSWSQQLVEKKEGSLHEIYHVLPSDSLVKNGLSELYYKGDLLERGNYRAGEKTGPWQYFHFGNFFAYEYDYDRDSLLRYVPRDGEHLPPGDHPCLFDGSPFIPYLFIVNHVFFPDSANRRGLEGETALVLEIDEKGNIVNRRISHSDHPLFSEAVMRACKKFPSEWRWIPARKNGEVVEGTFKMTVFFDQ